MKNENLTISEVEYSCKSKNITLLDINENWLKDFINEGNDLKSVLLHLSKKIFASNKFFRKQRIIALINVVKSIRKLFTDKIFLYSLNLVVRNLSAYRNQEKNGSNYIKTLDSEIIVDTLIILAFSNGFNDLLKSLYVKS